MENEVNTPTEAVIEPSTPSTPELGSQTPVAPKPEAEVKTEAPKSNREALQASLEKIKARDAEKEKATPKPDVKAEPKAEAKAEPKDVKAPEPKPEKARDETGKFQSQNTGDKPVAQEPKAEAAAPERRVSLEAPARFNENGKKDWATAPDTVKEEVHRALKEMEEGHKKYKESAERYDKVREFDELARKNGREGVHESLKQIVEIENAFSRNPIEGMKKITDHFGLNLQAVAAHIMGQNPDHERAALHGEIQQLKAKISEMENAAKVPSIVEQFFTENEDAKDYSDDIAFVLEQGIVKDLEAAYQYVKRFKPQASNATASSQPLTPAESVPAQTQAPALNPAGSKSVSGAPTNGVSPASKHPVPANNREALQRAMARARA
jgi:hypothetical protein